MMPAGFSPNFFLSCQEMNLPCTCSYRSPSSSSREKSSPSPLLQLYSYMSGSAETGHSSFGSGSAGCRRLWGSQTLFASSGGRVPLPDGKHRTGSESRSSSATLQVVP